MDVLGSCKFSVLFLHSGKGVALEHGADVLEGVGPHHRALHLMVVGPQDSPEILNLKIL